MAELQTQNGLLDDPVNPLGNPSLPATSPVSADERQINQPTQTVAGQLTGLLETDSPYITRARTRAAQTANSRGLINSSMAAGAGEAAAIDAALPVAQQDAQTYTQQQYQNQNASNQAKLFNADFGNQTFFRQLDTDNRLKVDQQQQQQQLKLAEMDRDLRLDLAAIDVSQKDYAAFSDYISNTSQQYQVQQTNISTDPGLSVEEKNRALQDLSVTYRSNMQVMSDLYGVDISWVTSAPVPTTQPATTTYPATPIYSNVEQFQPQEPNGM